ncbi:MAG: YdeI/OmpD-associated family protein [Alphaproteobacteria bacterium]|nr:YdeI/OmpD-associated family protein [Alphaproteobacteria bacterium]
MKDFLRVEVDSRAALRRWLEANHGQRESIWLVTFKKAAGPRHVPYDAIVEEALAFGWIDSLPRKLDTERTMLLLSPRKPGSSWSAVNRARVERMEAQGLMHATGRARVAAAKADGSWSRLDAVEALVIPDDLAAALGPGSVADTYFRAFPPSAKRGILEWIAAAKAPETRARRIADTAAKAADNLRANTPRQLKRR